MTFCSYIGDVMVMQPRFAHWSKFALIEVKTIFHDELFSTFIACLNHLNVDTLLDIVTIGSMINGMRRSRSTKMRRN